MSNNNQHEVLSVVEAARRRIESLKKEAKSMVDDHWQYYLDENSSRTKFSEQSRLYSRVIDTKNGFAIEWHYIQQWYKNPQGKWKKDTRYLARGRSFRVALNRYARDWELQRLASFEDRAEMIRREVTLLTNLIESYDRLARLRATKKAA